MKRYLNVDIKGVKKIKAMISFLQPKKSINSILLLTTWFLLHMLIFVGGIITAELLSFISFCSNTSFRCCCSYSHWLKSFATKIFENPFRFLYTYFKCAWNYSFVYIFLRIEIIKPFYSYCEIYSTLLLLYHLFQIWHASISTIDRRYFYTVLRWSNTALLVSINHNGA